MSNVPADLPDDPAILKAMIAALRAENAQMTATLRAHDLLVQALRLRIAKLKKQAFGKSSEKIEREIEQLELALEDLQVAMAETAPAEDDTAATTENQEDGKTPRRRPRVSDTTPRERRELDPGDTCPDCGGELRVVGEDVSELLDMIAARLKIIEIARIKKSCRRCESSRANAIRPREPENGAGTGAQSPHPAQHGRPLPVGLHSGLEIR